MPKRDRTHELETESQRAFAAAMPASVVVRSLSDDYGIDREVEVFVDGRTTGLTFKVQLKATDKSGTTQRIKRASLDYWRSLDVPVLLVSYKASSGTLRGRWVHSVGLDGPDNGAATLTIRMDPAVDLTTVTAESLAGQLSLVREVRRGQFPSPTPIRVEVIGDVDVSAAQLEAAVLTQSRRTRAPMRAATGEEQSLTITVSEFRVQAALPLSVGSCSLRTPDCPVTHLALSELAGLAMMLAAGAAATVNTEAARHWLSVVDPAQPWWAADEFAERFLPVLDHPDMADVLLRVYQRLTLDGGWVNPLYSSVLIDRIRDVDPTVFAEFADAVGGHLDGSLDSARLAFNLANQHRLRGEHALSLPLYELARETSPAYRDDPLLLRFYGASLREVGRYDDSAEVYEEALARGFDAYELLPLLADSLMYAGQYQRARQSLDAWVPKGAASDRVGVIRIVVLSLLLGFVGLREQDRVGFDRGAARRAYERARDAGGLTEAVLTGLLRDADALHPLPWLHLIGVPDGRVEFEPALVAAVIRERDPVLWVLALAGALAAAAPDQVVRAVVDEGRFLCGNEFYDAVNSFASEQTPEHEAMLRDLVAAAYAAEPERFLKHLRATDPGGAQWLVGEVTLPPASAFRQ